MKVALFSTSLFDHSFHRSLSRQKLSLSLRFVLVLFSLWAVTSADLLAQPAASELSPIIEHFDDNRRQWPQFEEPGRSAQIFDGSLHLTGSSNALPVFVGIACPGVESDSFLLSVTLTQTGGKKSMGYGLCWGSRLDQRDYYAFLISGDQQFTILRMERGRYQLIQPWTETSLILSPKNPNKLSVEQQGHRLIFSINDQRVFVGPASSLMGDLSGILYHGTMNLAVDKFELGLPPY